ncbi:hypothetical protein DMUE_4618, partial [Dictyocoela muelleri]
RRIIFVPVENRNSETLLEIISKYVDKESIIYTDCWRGYSGLNNRRFRHFTVNHSKEFVNIDNGVHTNTIEGNWSALKSSIPSRYRTRRHIQFHLLLYMLREI